MTASRYCVEARAFHAGNAAVQPYTTVEVEMFRHRFPGDDRDVLLVTQDELDDREDASGIHGAEFLRAYVDGIPADPDHPRIERMTEVQGQ